MAFAIGLLLMDCHIPDSLSLKDKRRVMYSITERLRRTLNIAVSEVEFQDQWQRARIAAAYVNTEWLMIQKAMSRTVEIVERDGRIRILRVESQRLN
ncbi:MAG: DUF503 domain-containing protein [candidate division WOR-3 bacterium]